MKANKTRVFITVKTYPTLSSKYDELVCTAGITDKGKWIRIYPIPFRQLKWEDQYKKYQWIELDLIKNRRDFRLESHSPADQGRSIQVKELVSNWEERKRIVFKEKVYTNMMNLVEQARSENNSLAIFKPQKILDFKIEPVERQWDPEKIKRIKENSSQLNLFDSDKPFDFFKIVNKLPYKFSYVFEDEKCRQSTLMIEDWEIGALYWNCLKREKNEKKACQKVKQKYLNEFKRKDLHFFLGTTLKFHKISPNPFIIIGVFYPPVNNQQTLF